MKLPFYTQTVLISNDFFIVRDYSKVLDASNKFLLVEHFENVSDLFIGSKMLERIDVLLFDLHVVDITDLIKLKIALPQIKVLVIDSDTSQLLKVMSAGADGFLSNRKDFKGLLDQIWAIVNGEKSLDQASVRYLFKSFKKELQSDLTIREREVLEELSLSQSYKQIAEKLAISAATVKTHLEHVYDKLNANNRFDAINKARAKKLI